MTRYEGMDELLNRVGERLSPATELGVGPDESRGEVEIPRVEYETALNRILFLLGEVEQLRQVVQGQEYRGLPIDQIEDLLGALDKVQRELRRCEADLQR